MRRDRGRQEAGDVKKKNRKAAVLIGCAGALLLLTGFGVWWSYHGVTVRTFPIEARSFSETVQAAVISDLHENPIPEQVVSETRKAGPDLIFVVGDMLNSYSEDSDRVTQMVKELCAIAPVYYAWGNHEIAYLQQGHEQLREALEAAGAVVLDQEFVDISVKGTDIRVGGLYEYAFALDGANSTDPGQMDPEVYRFLTDFGDTDAYKIMLSHRPESFLYGEAAQTWNIDLVVCGHTHGGQVVLPFLGGLYAPEQGLFPEYVHGVYEKGNLTFAITSGLGSQSGRIPRFNNPPEIMMLELGAPKE